MAAEAQLRAAIGRKRLKRLALYPSFSLLGAASLTDISGPGGYTSGLWTLGAGIILPILDRGRLLADARVASAQAEIASVTFEKAVQTAFADARNAIRVVSADDDGLTILESAEAAARGSYHAQQAGFTRGLIDSFAVWAAERTWLDRDSELQVARLRRTRDVMNAIYAVGGAWVPQPMESERRG
jgi:outer membrane protein TolC